MPAAVGLLLGCCLAFKKLLRITKNAIRDTIFMINELNLLCFYQQKT
jgi:hypothetical protein